jgi:hypothetical protein
MGYIQNVVGAIVTLLVVFPQAEPLDDGLPYRPLTPRWAALADCESGDRINGEPVEGSARWQYGHPNKEHPPWGYNLFHGGLQFWPPTWEWVAEDLNLLDAYPTAYAAPVGIQVSVAIEVKRRQGWEAWPTCSRTLGYQ